MAASSNAPAPPRAIVVFGRVGTYSTRAGALRSGVRGDLSLWRACAHTAIEHVLNPWRMSGSLVDVFVQSWNPDMAKEMDALWQPMASDHAEQNDSAAVLCPIKMKLCERTMWALLGLKRALTLLWQPSRECDAAAIDGYVTMCPEVPTRAVHFLCS